MYYYFLRDLPQVRKWEYRLTTTPIEKIKADPEAYEGQVVTVHGVVAEVVSVAGMGYFVLDDGTARLVVVPEEGMPAKQILVKVRGRIKQPLKGLGIEDAVILKAHEVRL